MAPKAKAKKQLAAPQSAADEQQAKPNWPIFSPLRPVSDLFLEALVPDQIVVIRNFWTSTLCKNYVSFLSSLPLVTTPGKPKKGEALRVNDRFQIEDPGFARQLWEGTALKSLVLEEGRAAGAMEQGEQGVAVTSWGGEVVGLNPRIRIYRYKKGQFFDQHYDESNTCKVADPATDSSIAAETTWTMLLYLTSAATGCKGGETVFYPEDAPRRKDTPSPEPVVVGLETGMVLLHKHGKDCMLHEGREVLEGEKWVIRSDLCVRR